MNAKPQIIYEGDKPAFVVLPWEDYQAATYLHHEAQSSDEELAERAEADNEEYFPQKVVNQLLKGEHPIRVYRQYRGFTQAELAAQVKMNKLYLSQIETDRRRGSVDTLKRIATVLNVDLDDLV